MSGSGETSWIIARYRKDGVEVDRAVDRPLFAFLGDTHVNVFERSHRPGAASRVAIALSYRARDPLGSVTGRQLLPRLRWRVGGH